MNPAMDALYQLVQESYLGPIIYSSRDYKSYCHFGQVQEDRLRAMLDEAGISALDSMLQERSFQHDEELAALFQATMLLCRDLDRPLRD